MIRRVQQFFFPIRKAREPSDWEDNGGDVFPHQMVTKPKDFWRVPTNHMAQGKCRDIPRESRPELLQKTEVFCNAAKLIYWKSTGKHADLPYHLRKHLAHKIPLRTAIPILPSSGKLTVATGKSHLLKNSLRLAACGQRASCVVLRMGAANLSIPKGDGFC